MLNVVKIIYTVPGIAEGNVWTCYQSYQIRLAPLTIKVTESMYKPFYEYFFSKDDEEVLGTS